MWKTTRRAARCWAALVVLIVTACGGGGGDTTSDATSAPVIEPDAGAATESSPAPRGPSEIGGTLTLEAPTTTLDVTVLQIVDPAIAIGASDPVTVGERLVAVEMLIENTGDGPYETHAYAENASLRGAGGEYWTHAEEAEGPTLEFIRLASGDVRRGWVAFAVDEAATWTALEYTAYGIDHDQPAEEIFSGDELVGEMGIWDLTRGAPATPEVQVVPGDVALGQAATVSGGRAELEVVVQRLLDPAPPTAEYEPDAGRHWIGVEITLVSRSDEPVTPVTAYRLIDAEGYQYLSDSSAETSAGPEFEALKEYREGEGDTGFVLFDVPDGTVPVKVLVSAHLKLSEGWIEVALR